MKIDEVLKKSGVTDKVSNHNEDIKGEDYVNEIKVGDFVEIRFKQSGMAESYFESVFFQGDVMEVTPEYIKVSITDVKANDETVSGGIAASVGHKYVRKFFFSTMKDVEVRSGSIRIELK